MNSRLLLDLQSYVYAVEEPDEDAHQVRLSGAERHRNRSTAEPPASVQAAGVPDARGRWPVRVRRSELSANVFGLIAVLRGWRGSSVENPVESFTRPGGWQVMQVSGVQARLDEAKIEMLRAWGEGLRTDPRSETQAAGRAITLLVEEIERLNIDLWHARSAPLQEAGSNRR